MRVKVMGNSKLVFDSFHDAYLYNLKKVYFSPDFINSPRGNQSRETLNNHFEIINPRNRVCLNPHRKTNIIFNFAETLWYLSGNNKLEFIKYYAKSFEKFSKNGITLTGSAYGPKIFSFGEKKINQWDKVYRHLSQEDSDSKRAVIQIFSSEEDLSLENPDVTCTLGLLFLIRNNKLYLNSFMRANDAYTGIVSDIFSFTMMQELMATQMKIEIGSYFHSVGSMDFFEKDSTLAEKLLNDKENTNYNEDRFVFPVMPNENNWPHIHKLIKIEKEIRTGKISLNNEMIQNLDLPKYWADIVRLFTIYRNILNKAPTSSALFQSLPPLYQYLLNNRWQLIITD